MPMQFYDYNLQMRTVSIYCDVHAVVATRDCLVATEDGPRIMKNGFN